MYHGYPVQETVWIGMFLIDQGIQGQGYGKELIASLCDACKKEGWASIGLAVHLKNWKGIRFWSRNGFDTITGIYGDKAYGDNAFSIMGLKRELL